MLIYSQHPSVSSPSFVPWINGTVCRGFVSVLLIGFYLRSCARSSEVTINEIRVFSGREQHELLSVLECV